jgi:hypothetical protein
MICLVAVIPFVIKIFYSHNSQLVVIFFFFVVFFVQLVLPPGCKSFMLVGGNVTG